jgi:hypothetical protein
LSAALRSRPFGLLLATVLGLHSALMGFGGAASLSYAAHVPESTAPDPQGAQEAQASQPGDEASRAPALRDEVVYAKLNASGTVHGIYAVTTIENPAKSPLEDFGAFDAVRNLTDTSSLQHAPDSVRVTSHAEQFTYQGDLVTKRLPWELRIDYTLDGKQVMPSALAGTSGRLELALHTKQAIGIDPVFFEHYVLQATVTLDGSRASDVQSETASIVMAGSQRVATFTILPGKEAVNRLSAQVSDFELASVQIAAIPFSMAFDLPDTSGLTAGLDDLLVALALLDEGAAKLKTGADGLSSGAASVEAGSSSLQSGLSRLAQQSGLINSGSEQILTALDLVAGTLGQIPELDLETIKRLPAILDRIADEFDDAATQVANLGGAYQQAIDDLDALMQNLPQTNGPLDQLVADLAANNQGDATIQALAQYYFASQSLVSSYYLTVRPALADINTYLQQLIDNSALLDRLADALRGLADGIPDGAALEGFLDQITGLLTGMQQLAGSYRVFHQGLLSYNEGVLELNDSYGGFHNGLEELAAGTGLYQAGVSDYASGVRSLRLATDGLPDLVRDQIDEFMADYQSSDFTPVSFLSDKNADTRSVQFVFVTDPIEKPRPPAHAVEVPAEPSILDRLLALFGQ